MAHLRIRDLLNRDRNITSQKTRVLNLRADPIQGILSIVTFPVFYMGVKFGLSQEGRNIRTRDLENRLLRTIFGPEKEIVTS